MKKTILLSAVLATFALGACQKQDDASNPPAAAPGPVGSPAATGAPAPGQNYRPPEYANTQQYSDAAEVPAADIGVSVSAYPDLVQVPGYPVYYAPRMSSNYFFYDGMYWVYQRDNWYASSWYNGPWGMVAPEYVPLFILRVPVRYYREPPAYFRGWQGDAAPQWGVHWGRDWEQHRNGWDKWNHNEVPAPAPLPTYQRQFSGNKYPAPQQQNALHGENYHYQPKDAAVEHVFHAQEAQKAAAPMQKGQAATPQERNPKGAETKPQQSAPPPHAEPPKREMENAPKPAPMQAHPQNESRPAAPREQPPQLRQKENQVPERAAPQHEQPAAKPIQERPPQARSAPPEPKPAPPHPQESRPPEKAAPPHEQPAARPAQEKPPQAKPAPQPKEEKREEERK
jgi:hypothetical protein